MAIKRIFSAGGIVLRPIRRAQGKQAQDKQSLRSSQAAGLKSSDRSRWEILITQHSKHKGWDFPKGHREIYESEEQTALREVEEETGVKAEIIEKVGETKYFYWEEGPSSAKASEGKEKVLKTVVFFLMKYVSEGKATTAFEVSGKKWLHLDKVEAQLTFKDTKALWEKARSMIEQLTINI